MSLADLVPVAIECGYASPKRVLTPAERHQRWVAKNREKYNAYRRKWYAERKRLA